MNNITGKGMVFPIEVEDGTVKSQTGYALIRSCIYNILAFEYGDRYFQRDFGVQLRSLLGEPNDLVTEALLDYRLRTQLPLWDNRLEVVNVTIARFNHVNVNVVIEVKVRGVDNATTYNIPLEDLRP